jgi:ketosteroid isomerase-like protein
MPASGNIGAVDVVVAFNNAINSRDITALTELMTESHRFIDANDATTRGKDECTAAWRDFFGSFPDYRNVFDELLHIGGGVVVAHGHSECSVAALDGPARWRAVVIDGRVEVWQVSNPSPGA